MTTPTISAEMPPRKIPALLRQQAYALTRRDGASGEIQYRDGKGAWTKALHEADLRADAAALAPVPGDALSLIDIAVYPMDAEIDSSPLKIAPDGKLWRIWRQGVVVVRPQGKNAGRSRPMLIASASGGTSLTDIPAQAVGCDREADYTAAMMRLDAHRIPGRNALGRGVRVVSVLEFKAA